MPAGIPRPSSTENVSTTLSSGINAGASTMDVADATGIVAPCYLVLDRVDSSGTLKTFSSWEYVKVTNVASNTLTITRGQNGSSAQSHSSGAVVEAVVTSAMFEDWYATLNPEHTASGGHVIATATINYTETFNLAVTSTASIANLNLSSLNLNSLAVASSASIFNGQFNKIGFLSTASTTLSEGITNADGNLFITPSTGKLVGLGMHTQNDTSNVYQRSVIMSGWGYVLGDGTNSSSLTKTVNLPISLATAPVVVVSGIGFKDNSNPSNITDFTQTAAYVPSVGGLSATVFVVQSQNTGGGAIATIRRVGFSWTAIGQI